MLHVRRAPPPAHYPFERAIAASAEAGARVGRNVALAAMNIDVPVHDARRIEVVCNGLPLCTAHNWPLTRRSSAR